MKLTMPNVKDKYFAFNGGLNLVTPPIELPPGYLRSCLNVEVGINGGYSTLGGYERYSGKAKPSAAAYAILTCTITGTVALGDVLTDNAGTSYGTVIALPTGQAVLTLITGTFSTGNIKVGATVVGTCVGAQAAGSASTPALNATYLNLAADVYRALIAEVTGEGSILGVWQYNNKVYAFRNNVGSTAAGMFVSSASGWTAVALGREISFTSGGVTEIVVGNTITGAISGATAVITKVILTSGAWGAGTAAGRFFFASQTGTFQAEDLNVGAAPNLATIAGNSTAITLSPSGRYEFENFNFSGTAGTKKMYGCDGVNKGFEFDGTTFVKINTGMTTDTPTHLHIHKNQLFFSFAGSAQHSGIGTPYVWTPVTGASELGCGDTITGFLELPGNQTNGAMAIFTEDRTLVLYGNDALAWNLVVFSDEAGAVAHTVQYVTQGIMLDKKGISTLGTVEEYGNFQNSVVSGFIKPYLNPLINTAVASTIIRDKNQYRLFFTSGAVVCITFKDKKILGITTGVLTDAVTCICSLEGSSGLEEIYFGSDDGFVYQMDVGTSFDGDPIEWRFETAFNHLGSPRQLKEFTKSVTEVTGDGYAAYSFSYSIGYASTDYEAPLSQTATTYLTGTNWDSFTWDQFFWDGRNLAPSEADLGGTEENISLIYSGNSDEYQPITFNSQIVHYKNRRGKK